MLRAPLPAAPPPHEAHALLAARHGTTFILESREGPRRLARFSFVGFDPAGTVRCDRTDLHVTGDLPRPTPGEAPLTYLRRALDHHRPGPPVGATGTRTPASAPATDFASTPSASRTSAQAAGPASAPAPFAGGFVGSLGYDFAHILEPVLETGNGPPDAWPTDDASSAAWPRLLLGFYADAIVYDHHDGTVHYVSHGADRSAQVQAALAGTAPEPDPATGPPEEPDPTAGTSPAALPRPTAGTSPVVPPSLPATGSIPIAPLHVGPVTAHTDSPTFQAQVRRAQELVRAGECFQIVLSRAYTAPYTGGLGALYDHLRDVERVPYLYHLRFADVGDGSGPAELVGASPEGLVTVRGSHVVTHPIAGTRPLTGDPAQDDKLATELAADRKETAEHAMLVDLARNDLSRVCTPGTVQVEAYQEVHRFHRVQHLVSRVTGTLEPDRDALDALAAVFPAGTVSGAPKLRAMEHIHTIESRPRGPYAGAVCYLSLDGELDSAIAIRSLSARANTVTVQAGAGVVLRSDPAAEFAETRSKAGTLLEALAHFGATLPDESAPAVEVAP